MQLPDLPQIEAAAAVVYREFQATPQYRWALLSERLGTDCWVKHENHTPVGAFKIRGGLTFFDDLRRRGALPAAVISATRGNHGQSVGFAARRYGVPATIVVPHGNSVEKNAAMRALGVTLVEHGDDFQAAREHAINLAETQGLHMVPSFHPELCDNLYAVYMFCLDRITFANLHNEATAIDEVLRVLAPVREAFTTVVRNGSAAAEIDGSRK